MIGRLLLLFAIETILIPRNIEITTKRYGAKLPEGCHIKVRKPPAVVTDENWKYLQFIDMFDELPDTHTDAENPEELLLQYVKRQQLDSLTLIFTACRYYPKKIVLPLIDLLMGVKKYQYKMSPFPTYS